MRFNKFANYLLIAAILFFSIKANCKEPYPEDYRNEVSISGVNAEIIANGVPFDERKPAILQRITDGKYDTSLVFNPTSGGKTLQINFLKPVYIKEIILTIDLLQLDPQYRDNEIMIEIASDKQTMPCEGLNYKINGKNETCKISFQELRFANILKFKLLAINFMRTIYIKELNIIYNNQPNYSPSISVDTIQKKYLKNSGHGLKEWEFSFSHDQKIDEEKLEFEILQNLIYQAILGDKKVEKIFLNYSPSEADKGEVASSLKSWFLNNKK
jgi:hypothetical protein